MTKKEINEIKALFDTVQDCGITRLTGCYVNGEKEKVKTFSDRFYNIAEEDMYKYLEIFRKTLSGTPGKNLVDMSFSDNSGEDRSLGRGLLERLRGSELADDAVLDEFYDSVIKTYEHTGNYLILLICQSYDIPGITSDGIELEDASEEIFSYILCSICPMKLTKPGLGYDDTIGEIHKLRQMFAVEKPETGFLYPSFNERSTDVTALLYSTSDTKLLQERFIEKLLGVSAPLPAKQQKDGFVEFVSDVLGEEPQIETVLSLQENLRESAKSKKSESAGETVFFDKSSMRDVFERSGVTGEQLENFEKRFDEQFDMSRIHKKQKAVRIDDEDDSLEPEEYMDHSPTIQVEEKLFADNVAPVRSLEVRNKNMVLRINSGHTDILDTRVIDGRKCLVIEVTDDLRVNGIPVE